MDSKQVTKEINSVIRPLLKENGFNKFSGRTYWRYNSDRIDIVNFQSFNSYNAEVMDCTTYSFAVNLATFLNYIPPETDIKEKNGLKRPAEFQGHFRGRITKEINQKGFSVEDIWLVSNDGTNLSNVIADCYSQIQKEAFNWFDQFKTQESILRILLEDQIDIKDTWGFGNIGSPNRNKLIAYTAIELGKNELAIDKLKSLQLFYEEQYSEMKYEYDLKRIMDVKKEIEKIRTTHNKSYISWTLISSLKV